MNGTDTYDITKYSDTELYNILDVINPTDRELEARILFLIHKYDNMQNKSGDELANFFRKIYAHFFEVSDDEMEEHDEEFITETNNEQDRIVNGEVEGFTINPDGTVDNSNTKSKTTTITGNVENDIIDNYNKTNGNSVPKDIFMKQLSDAVKKTTQDKNSVAYVNTLNYTQDKLNPLLKQTIKRIISIDSQYRDDKRTLSTQFTFNLSDPLKDVLSIKLYSIQIPYTWYTISTSYGSNFFYLKGNSPGINDGNYDYQFSVQPGNYSPSELVTTIGNSITTIKNTYTDVDFGNTDITYNNNTCRATINIDIIKTYNETSYYLDFPTWQNPNDDTSYNSIVNYVRKQSIPSFLGFNYQTYYPNILYSNFLPKKESTATIDNTSALYYIDSRANYFTIYKYIGPDEYDDTTSVIDVSFNIKLSKTGLVSRNDLVTDLSNQLANNNYLINSTINRYNITDTSYCYDPSNSLLNKYYYLKGRGYSQFQLAIKFNRLTTNNKKFSKIYIEFPTESSNTGNPVWTGSSSCFNFQSLKHELNNVIAETSPVPDQLALIRIKSEPYIYLKCKESGYDISQNNYRIDISNNTTGYTFQGFVDNINKALVNINNYTKTTNTFYSNVALGTILPTTITDVSKNNYFNINGDFNITNTIATIDTNSYFNISLDINKKFTNDMYRLDTRDTNLKNLLNLSGDYLYGNMDLNGTYIFSSQILQSSEYTLDSGALLKIYPSTKKYGNQNSGNIIVTMTGGTFNSYSDLQTSINNSFNNYTDSTGSYILQGTNIVLNVNSTNTNYIDCTFTIKIQKTISQDKYNILFYDASGYSNNIFDYTKTSWYQLAVDASFMTLGVDLSRNIPNIVNLGTITTLIPTSPILSNSIKFTNDNNYFYIKPYDSGVISIDGANDIMISIPAYDSSNSQIIYSRTLLLGAINNALNSTIYTYGSSISIYSVNNVEYTKFRINVTKIYTTKDYKLVFYDQQSFVKCYTGVSSVTNTTWDTTMGWILGYRESTTYDMADYFTTDILPTNINYYVNNKYKKNNTINLIGDTSVSVNLFNYFLLCMDDFNQNHLNDGLVTLSPADTTVTLPSYANRSNFTCDPVTGLLTYNTNIINPTTNSRLTQNQIYAITETANGSSSAITRSSTISSKSFGTGPFVKDVFALIPIKTSGMQNGSVYVDFSGTLQNQERVYFGPVNIHRMSISLVSDRGDVVNLNGTNWSFSFLCEQLYQQRPMST
jgi:hypothetical protein